MEGHIEPELSAQVRRFNRAVTQRVGALSDACLARDRPLGRSRFLWEIAHEGTPVRDLRQRLGLDSGLLSRILRSLESEGLIDVVASRSDGRVRVARLTEAGRAERAELDRLSDELAASMLRPLDESRRRRLVGAMAEVERLLTSSEIELRPGDPGGEDARACFDAYVAELVARTGGDFEPTEAPSLVSGPALVPPAGILVIARLRGEAVGTGALTFDREDVATLHRMWVAPTFRGYGVGRRLLAELESYAVARGVTTLRLETKRILEEAVALYRSSGFGDAEPFSDDPYADCWLEKLVGRLGPRLGAAKR